MDSKEKRNIEERIKNLKSLIENASPGNPDIPRWKQEIENLKARLTF